MPRSFGQTDYLFSRYLSNLLAQAPASVLDAGYVYSLINFPNAVAQTLQIPANMSQSDFPLGASCYFVSSGAGCTISGAGGVTLLGSGAVAAAFAGAIQLIRTGVNEWVGIATGGGGGGGGGAGNFTSIVNTGLTDLSAVTAGQIKFPVVQNASADLNTLDDYEEGTWVPTVTFATPGNLAVTYSVQSGKYTKIGNLVTCNMAITTSAFTFTSASGNLMVTGLPYVSSAAVGSRSGLSWTGITNAAIIDLSLVIQAAQSFMVFVYSASGIGNPVITAVHTPTGGTIGLNAQFSYFTA